SIAWLEVENDAGRDAEVVLVARAQREFVEASEQVVDLDRPQGKVVGYLGVHAAADGHGKRDVRGREAEPLAAANMRHAEQHLSEGGEMVGVGIGNARAEKIGGKGAVNSRAQNMVGVIAAEVRDTAEPASGVVRNRCAASV